MPNTNDSKDENKALPQAVLAQGGSAVKNRRMVESANTRFKRYLKNAENRERLRKKAMEESNGEIEVKEAPLMSRALRNERSYFKVKMPFANIFIKDCIYKNITYVDDFFYRLAYTIPVISKSAGKKGEDAAKQLQKKTEERLCALEKHAQNYNVELVSTLRHHALTMTDVDSMYQDSNITPVNNDQTCVFTISSPNTMRFIKALAVMDNICRVYFFLSIQGIMTESEYIEICRRMSSKGITFALGCYETSRLFSRHLRRLQGALHNTQDKKEISVESKTDSEDRSMDQSTTIPTELAS